MVRHLKIFWIILGFPLSLVGQDSQYYQDRGNVFWEENKFDSALIQYQLEYDCLFEEGDWDNATSSLLVQGSCNYYLGDYEAMEKVLQECQEISSQYLPSSHENWGILFQLLSLNFKKLGAYYKAIDLNLQAIENLLNQERTDRPALAKAYNNLGVQYRLVGDPAKAISYFEEALGIIQGIESGVSGQRAKYHNNLGIALNKTGKYQEALTHFFIYLNHLRNNPEGNRKKEVPVLGNISMAYFDLGDTQEALKFERQALQIDNSDPEAHHNMGFLLKNTGSIPDAKRHYLEAISLYKKSERFASVELSKEYRHLGDVALALGQSTLGLNHYQRSLAYLAPNHQDSSLSFSPKPNQVLSKLHLLRTLKSKAAGLSFHASQVSQEKDFLEIAVRTSSEAIRLMDILREEYAEGSKEFLLKKFRPVYQTGIQVATRLHALTGEAKYAGLAFQWAEKSKAALLLEAIQEAGTGRVSAIPDSLYDREQQLKQELAFYRERWFREKQKGSRGDSLKTDRWRRQIFELEREYEHLKEGLKKNYPKYFSLKYHTDVRSLKEVQASLPDARVRLLEYYWGDSLQYVFSIGKDEAMILRLKGGDSLKTALDHYISVLRNTGNGQAGSPRDIQEVAVAGFELYTLLMPPGAIPARTERVIVVTDGKLAYLPFEALVTSKSDDLASFRELDFLVGQMDVQYAYSATLLLEATPPRSDLRLFAGFGPGYSANTRFASNGARFKPLRFNQTEVEAISSLLGGEAYVGKKASEAAFKSLKQARILHLAMHALTNDDKPMYSGLAFSSILTPAPTNEQISENRGGGDPESIDEEPLAASIEAEDGFLHAYELYNLHLEAELVVLSACKTGVGKLVDGEGLMSLARAFRYAGCPNLVTSLWPANDRATFQLMQSFYKHLKSGAGKASALRRAKLDYIQEQEWAHPHLWAGFIMIGDNAPMDLTPSFFQLRRVILIASGFLILGFVFWRRFKARAKK